MRLTREVMERAKRYDEIVRAVPDGYRGDPTCLALRPGFHLGKQVPPQNGGHYAVEVIDSNNEIVGVIESWYGNGGKGKLAEERFYLR